MENDKVTKDEAKGKRNLKNDKSKKKCTTSLRLCQGTTSLRRRRNLKCGASEPSTSLTCTIPMPLCDPFFLPSTMSWNFLCGKLKPVFCCFSVLKTGSDWREHDKAIYDMFCIFDQALKMSRRDWRTRNPCFAHLLHLTPDSTVNAIFFVYQSVCRGAKKLGSGTPAAAEPCEYPNGVICPILTQCCRVAMKIFKKLLVTPTPLIP